MTALTQFHGAWRVRPADETFESLWALGAAQRHFQESAEEFTISSKDVRVQADENDLYEGLSVMNGNAKLVIPTHWALGQLSSLAKAPAQYIRRLPAALIADNLNWNFRHDREVSSLKLLSGLNRHDVPELRAATGPDYGRVWNTEIVDLLIDLFGDGVSGQWIHAGKGKNSTLFGSDRDVWIFLVDEEAVIEIPNRRNGQPGTMKRGLVVSNSEVGSGSLYVAAFGLDGVCMNRTIFGICHLHETRIRHTVTAPGRWRDEIVPLLQAFAQSEPTGIAETIENARKAKLDRDVDEFLTSRFGQKLEWAKSVQEIHEAEEGRPIETLWDASVAVTAKARSIPHQDTRVALERQAGKLLDLVAVPA